MRKNTKNKCTSMLFYKKCIKNVRFGKERCLKKLTTYINPVEGDNVVFRQVHGDKRRGILIQTITIMYSSSLLIKTLRKEFVDDR